VFDGLQQLALAGWAAAAVTPEAGPVADVLPPVTATHSIPASRLDRLAVNDAYGRPGVAAGERSHALAQHAMHGLHQSACAPLPLRAAPGRPAFGRGGRPVRRNPSVVALRYLR
jgi:hypothetical protein